MREITADQDTCSLIWDKEERVTFVTMSPRTQTMKMIIAMIIREHVV